MKFLPNAVTSRIGTAALKLSTVSPNLLFGAGIAGVVGTAVLASRATLKLESVLDEVQSDMSMVKQAETDPKLYGFTEQEIFQAKIGVYIKAVTKICKLYAPALAVGALSVAALGGSHRILTKRNAGLTAALAAVEKGFKAYRARVVEDLGEEKDREYLHGVEKIKETVVDKDGKKKVVERKVATATGPYGRMFHRGNRNWVDDPGQNLIFIKCQQNYLNDLLKSRGWVTLNDLYDSLGFERTKAGMVVGWKLGNGDNEVDFGLFTKSELGSVFEYVRGTEDELYINPNPDGNIFGKLEES